MLESFWLIPPAKFFGRGELTSDFGNFRKAAFWTANRRRTQCIGNSTKKPESSANKCNCSPRTRDWLRYEVPKYLRRDPKNYRGQKQIWFLLRFIGGDGDIKLLNSDAPEFEEWKWYDHRRTLREAAFFKRAVYTAVLGEFSRHLNSGKPSPEKLNADKK